MSDVMSIRKQIFPPQFQLHRHEFGVDPLVGIFRAGNELSRHAGKGIVKNSLRVPTGSFPSLPDALTPCQFHHFRVNLHHALPIIHLIILLKRNASEMTACSSCEGRTPRPICPIQCTMSTWYQEQNVNRYVDAHAKSQRTLRK